MPWMLVRCIVPIVLMFMLGTHARAEQAPTFVLSISKATGGNRRGLHLASFEQVMRERESVLKPALLAKTKANRPSRLSIKVQVTVAGKGLVRATVVDVNYRNAEGPITDETITTIVEDAFLRTPQQVKAIGSKVDVSISILQP